MANNRNYKKWTQFAFHLYRKMYMPNTISQSTIYITSTYLWFVYTIPNYTQIFIFVPFLTTHISRFTFLFFRLFRYIDIFRFTVEILIFIPLQRFDRPYNTFDVYWVNYNYAIIPIRWNVIFVYSYHHIPPPTIHTHNQLYNSL